jgi:hypothetical protein
MATTNPFLEKSEQASQALIVGGISSSFPTLQDFLSPSPDIDLALNAFESPKQIVGLIQQQIQYNKIIYNAMLASTGALTQMDIDGLTKLIEMQTSSLIRIEEKLDKTSDRLGGVEQRISKIEGILTSVATKDEISDVRADLHKEITSSTRWSVGTMFAIATLALAAAKIFGI